VFIVALTAAIAILADCSDVYQQLMGSVAWTIQTMRFLVGNNFHAAANGRISTCNYFFSVST
jgi:hypothetical protein